MDFSQGDIIKMSGFRNLFVVVSKNSFIKSTGMFHVCPVLEHLQAGPTHILVTLLKQEYKAAVICEQIKLIDPKMRGVGLVDRISYADKMEVSDTVQGIFEYD